MKTTLLIATLNEIEGAKIIMPRINREWVDEIILVDGGSTDGTIEFFEKMGIQVVNQKSKGICGAYWEGMEVATGDVIIPFSPDNNSIPELIPDLVKKMEEGYDMVIVSRYISGAKSEDDDFITALGNWMFTKMVNILFGGNYTDSLVMFRAFKKELVNTLPMVDKTTPVFEYQLCIRCAKKKMKVADIPGDEPKRIGGVRKMKPIYNGSCLLWCLLKEFLRGK
jgi:glycosyltransferase involved in cell wall biosynthesis